uniref:Uncharacterized protein n=1 Tax=Anser cygnoides TaxID=8845 RepID=A0A8B9DKF3_ANSCY
WPEDFPHQTNKAKEVIKALLQEVIPCFGISLFWTLLRQWTSRYIKTAPPEGEMGDTPPEEGAQKNLWQAEPTEDLKLLFNKTKLSLLQLYFP